MTTGPPTQCGFCRHYRRSQDGQPSCAAFPAGVPDVMLRNQHDHREPYPGDNGVRWLPDGDVEFPEFALNLGTPRA